MDINMENNKKSVIKSLAINEKDTGSSEIQIGLLTQKIDKHSSLGLLKAINRRKRLLEYLKNHNVDSYNNILSKLNLRK